MLRRFGGVGNDLFSTTFQKVLMEAQEPDYYDDFKTEPLGNGAPAAIEVLYALGNSDEGELKDFYATLENSLKDEMWTMTDEQLVDVLKVICPYLIHKTLHFLGEIPLKKLSKIPVNLFNILIKDPKLMQMMSFTLRRQAAEANVQFFRAVVKDPIQLAFKGETSKERLEGLKQLAEIIGDSEVVFRHFSNLCALYYMQSKSSRWASLYRETIMKVKENQSGLTKFRDLFDLTSEISNCLRKKEISPASILLVRKQLEKLIQQQANFEERDYRQKVEEFNKKNGLTEGIKDKLLALWRQLKTKDTYNIFADPVTEAIAPNYFSIIKRPMDLSTIQSKIIKGNYQTILDMSKDVQLMLSNCMVYNKNTTWADYASDLRAKWDYICKNSSGQAATATTGNANKMGKPVSTTVSVRPDKVFGRAREAAAAAAAAKKSTNKKKTKQKYDSDASAGDDSDNDDDDDDESVIAQGRKMMVSKKSTSKAADSAADEDEDDEDSYVGPASRRRPERTAKKRRIVEDSSDEEGVGARYVTQDATHADSSDEEAFQPRTPLEKKMLKLWNFVDRSDTRHIFLNRVTDDVAPNYSQVVRTPMYLTLIKSKMAKGEYTDIEQFHKDINLIFSNCIFYNGDTSDLGKFAGQMRDKYRKFVEKEENPAHRASKSGNTTTITAISGLPPLQIPKSISSDGPTSSASNSGSLKNLLSLLWKKLVDLDTFSYFLNAVSDDIAPGYSKEIEYPMYLSLMKKKIARGDYKNIDAFHEDVNLIVDNCIQYNGDDSDLAATAEEFRNNYFTFFQQDMNVQAQVAALQHGGGGGVTPANASGVPLSRQVSTSGSDSTLQDLLLDVWTQVVAMDTQGIFLDKVTNKTAPNYSSIIRRPMYLLLMKEKILQGEYRRVEDFSADVKLIVENCKKYNGPDSSFAKYAQDFGNKYLALSKTLPKTSSTATSSAAPTVSAATANTHNAAAATSLVEMEETEESLMKRIKEAWLVLYEKDTYKLFVDPITDTIAPGYSKKIKHPMCLSDMKAKAKSKLYPHFTAFADDVRTMFNNCAIYNGKDSEVAVYGQGLLKDFEQYVAKSKPQYKKSTVVQAVLPGSANASSSSSSSSFSGPDLKTIKNSILEAIESIRSADNLAIFEDKVTLPGYSRVVKKPMYVKHMEEKAKNMSYRNFQDFHADVTLMFDNCHMFNKGNVQILQYADTVKANYEATKTQLMATKLVTATSHDNNVAASNNNTNNNKPIVNSSSTTTTAVAVTPTAPKQFPARPIEHADLVAVDSPQLQNLQERLKRETYVPIIQIYATAQRVAHTRQYTVPEMRFIHKTFVDEILFPMQEYSSLVPIDSTEETMLIKTYLPQHNINKLKSLRPENAMFGANITKLNEVLSTAVDFLMKLDTPNKFFREIPTDAIAPDYSKLVKYPMAISLLREKVKHSAYRSITDFHEDVLYIAKNCLDYNGMDSVISKAAVELIVRWYVYFGFMVHFYPFLCRSSPSDVSQIHNANGHVKSPGGANDSISGGPSPHVIPKKRRAMSFDEKEDSKDGSLDDKNGHPNKVGAGSPLMKKSKTEVSSPSYLIEIESMLSAAAVGHKHDDPEVLLPSIVTVSEDEWRKFIEKLLTKKANVSSQKTNILISKLTELMVPFLRAQDSRKLFTRPLPQAKEVDKSEFMDFATMMVKVDRNKYASTEELSSDVKKMVRNRLITERFTSQDTHNTNDFSLYAMGMFTLMTATVELLQAVVTDKAMSMETAMAHVPLYAIKSTSSQSHAVSHESKITDIVIDVSAAAAATGVLGENIKNIASPPKIRRQVSEDGEVLSDDEVEAEKKTISTDEKADDKIESSILEKNVMSSDAKEDTSGHVTTTVTDSKTSVMCMDVDDEVKEEFVAPPLAPPQPVDVPQETVVVAPPKTTVTSSKGMFDTETFDSDEEEEHANATNTVAMNNTTVSETPANPAEPSVVPTATIKKVAVNDVKSLFHTEAFDSDEEEESIDNNNNNKISKGKNPAPTIAVLAPPATAPIAPSSPPAITKAIPSKKATDLKKQKPSLGSLFETEAFDSSSEDDKDEKVVDQKATSTSILQPLPESSNISTNKIRKKIQLDSSDDEDFSSIVNVKPPQPPAVKLVATSLNNIAKPTEQPVISQQVRAVPSSTIFSGSSSTGTSVTTSTVSTNNNVALNPPQPSETLLSSRRAVEYLQHLSTALHQHVQGQRESFRASETHVTEPVVCLPGILTVTTLRWSIILLKIAGFQTMLLPLYATEIVLALLSAKDEKSSLLYKHQRVLFFTQLCCLGVTNDLLLYGLEGEQEDTGLVATMLREWIPLLLCSVLDRNIPECDVETLVAPFFTAVKVEPAAVTDTTAGNTTAAAPTKETPTIGADKDKCVKFLTDLRVQLMIVWKEKSSSLEI